MTEVTKKRGVLGGQLMAYPDMAYPDKGQPFRHTRRKCFLMMEGMNGDKYGAALRLLIDKHPGDVLDALIAVSGELERENDETGQKE